MAHEWSPSDLPADFKLFEWDFARDDLIALDANGGISSIADTWQGRLAGTASVNDRRKLAAFNGVQGAFKPGSGADTRADGIILSDLTGLPAGNADRYLGFAAVAIDGIIGGYRGNTDKIYCFDTPSDPGLRFYYDTNRVTSQLPVDKTLAHFYAGKHASSVSKLRVDGMDAGTYPATLQTVLDSFGIAGAQTDFYGIVGYSFYAIVGKRAPTQDEEWLIEAWVAKYKTKRTVPNDNPYRTTLPMVPDGTVTTAPDSASHAHVVGAPVAISRASVAPNAASHAHTNASPAVAARFSVQPDAAAHQQAGTSPALASRAAAQAAGASHAHVATQPALAVAGMLVANDASHAHVATSPALSPRAIVVPGAASQAHRATQPAISAAGSIAVDSALHAQATTSPAVQPSQAIAVASARHPHAATAPAITPRARISPVSASHGHLATPAPLFVGTRPLPPSSRTVKSEATTRLVRSPRPSRLAA